VRHRYLNLIATFAFAATAATTHAQGTFQNLDFESASLPVVPPGQYGGSVPISEGLPDWSASIGGVTQSGVVQNDFTTGAGSIDIFGPDWTGSPGIIDGDYSILFQPGGLNSTASIDQTGSIPAGTQTLLFDAYQYVSSSPIPFTVSFAGNTLSPFVIGSATSPSGQGYNVYAANVSAYAGNTGPLEFTATGQFNWLLLDDISFSATAAPEPGPWILALIGGLLVFIKKR
jgi:hypothetical protein